MDTYTLLVILNVCLLLQAVFSIIGYSGSANRFRRYWPLSSIFIFFGALLLLLQNFLPPVVSIIISNYFLVLGFSLQVISSPISHKYASRLIKYFIPLSSILFFCGFIYFTYFNFNTNIRIIIISAILLFLFVAGFFGLMKPDVSATVRPGKNAELKFLFLLSIFFYAFRIFFTSSGAGRVSTLFDRNIISSTIFIYMIFYNIGFLLGMFLTDLRFKKNLILFEKEKLNILFNFLSNTAKHLDSETLYREIDKALKSILEAEASGIYLLDKEHGYLDLVHSNNAPGLPLDGVQRFRVGEGISGRVVERNEIVSFTIDTYPVHSVSERFKARGINFLIGIPLRTPEGVIGVITLVFMKKIESFDAAFYYYLGEQIGLVLNNSMLYEKINSIAHLDPLTGLFNRRKMLEALEAEVKRFGRSGIPFSIAIADLDFFKDVNDRYGHEKGDSLLRRAAVIFREECREIDFICRWGGEEFLFAFVSAGITDAKNIAERIRERFSKKCEDCPDDLVTTISIGLTECKKGLPVDKLISLADSALYLAKSNGRNRVEIK